MTIILDSYNSQSTTTADKSIVLTQVHNAINIVFYFMIWTGENIYDECLQTERYWAMTKLATIYFQHIINFLYYITIDHTYFFFKKKENQD